MMRQPVWRLRLFVGARVGLGGAPVAWSRLRACGASAVHPVYSTVFGRTKVERARGRGRGGSRAEAARGGTRQSARQRPRPRPGRAARGAAARRTVVPSRTPFRSTSPGARVPRACRPAPGPRRTGLGRPASRADPTPTRCTLRATHRRTPPPEPLRASYELEVKLKVPKLDPMACGLV